MQLSDAVVGLHLVLGHGKAASLSAGHRTLGVVLTALEMMAEVVQLDDGRAAVVGVLAAQLAAGQQVAEYSGNGLQLVGLDGLPVNRAGGLARDPFPDAGETEGVLAVGGLHGILQDARANGAEQLLVHCPVKAG